MPYNPRIVQIASRPLWLAAIVALMACGQPDRMEIVDFDPLAGAIFRAVTAKTVDDFDAVSSTHFEVLGDVQLHVDDALPLDEGLGRDAIAKGGEPAAANVLRSADADGALWVAEDLDSLIMLSALHHLEAASDFFESFGVQGASAHLPLFYAPAVITDDPQSTFPTSDNAAYLVNADGFLLFPTKILEDLPFSVNAGVWVHEYAHRVFYQRAYGSQMFDLLLTNLASPRLSQTKNLLRATDEGLCDYFAAVALDAPGFLSLSLEEELARPLDVVVAIEPHWLSGLGPLRHGAYDPYALGHAIAGALWRAGERIGHEPLVHALLAAQSQLFETLRDDFDYSVGTLEALALSNLLPTQQDSVCPLLLPTYGNTWAAFEGICDNETPP